MSRSVSRPSTRAPVYHAFYMRRVLFATFGVGVLLLVMAGVSTAVRSGDQALDVAGPISYVIGPGDPRSGFHPTDVQLAQWAFDAWARTAGGPLRFEATIEANALVRLYWAEASDGQYG